MRPLFPWIGVTLAIASATRSAACLSETEAAALVAQWQARQPVSLVAPDNAAEASCTRAKFNALLEQKLGPVIGYKAGLTNPAVQKRFNATEPVWGKLYTGMLVASGATVEAGFGTRPLFESDLLVRVKSAAINQATTPLEVLAAIDQVIPFIELPDLVVTPTTPLNGLSISAINVGAGMGVAGTPGPVPATRGERYALLDGLRDMVVTLSDGGGATLGQGKGSDILGHPLNAVVFLAQALAKEGLAMKPGDLISLGSFSPLLPPKAGQKVVVRYDGLPGAQPVAVQFR